MGARARGAGLEGTLFRHSKNAFFSRNLGQTTPKNVYFLEKKLENRRSVGGPFPEPHYLQAAEDPAPQTPALYSHLLTGIDCRSAFLALNIFYYFKK